MASTRRRSGKSGPWRPESIGELGLTDDDLRALSYVVIDEVVGPVAALEVSAWPAADRAGRIRFEAAAVGDLVVPVDELAKRLYRGWLRRAPRVGDVLATRLDRGLVTKLRAGNDVVVGQAVDLGEVLAHEVYDVSGDARTVAKIAFHAAATRPIPRAEAERRHQLDTVPKPTRRARPGKVKARSSSALAAAAEPATEDGAAPTAPWHVPVELVDESTMGGFVTALRDDPSALAYVLLNVGDGDAQLVLLPTQPGAEHRRVMVVDAVSAGKVLGLLDDLADEGVLPDLDATPGVLPLVVATHPHEDHIGGLGALVERFGAGGIADFWEPGYYHPSVGFIELMARLEQHAVSRIQPTAGTTRWVDGVKVTALSPGVGLRMRYDSYGVDVNDASIALRLEFPAARVAEGLADVRAGGNREYLRLDSPWALILGADAQTMSWSQVAVDFPQLHQMSGTALYRELSAARGRDYLAAEVFKVSHHGSKHGVNLELVERIGPRVTLVSSVGGGGRYNFPHQVAVNAVREALEPTTTSGNSHSPDHELGIHYTAATTERGGDTAPLGSIAVVLPAARGGTMQLWRFGDTEDDPIDLRAAMRMSRPYGSP